MKTLRDLPQAAVQAVTSETNGEIVRWIGQPSASGVFWRSTPVWLMGVPWLALSGGVFSAFLAGAIYGNGASSGMGAWGPAALVIALLFIGTFVVVGLGMVGWPFWAWVKSRRMVYVITDKRLVRICWSRSKIDVKSFNPEKFVTLERKQKRDGSGTLTVTVGSYKDSDGDSARDVELIVGVPDVATADKLLRELMDQKNGDGNGGDNSSVTRTPPHIPRSKAA